jgi:hypothetical protein
MAVNWVTWGRSSKVKLLNRNCGVIYHFPFHHNQVPVTPMTYYAREIVMGQMLNAKMLLVSRDAAIAMGWT